MARVPSHSPFIVAIACSASVLSRKAAKPNPLDFPETGSHMTWASLKGENVKWVSSHWWEHQPCLCHRNLRHGTKSREGLDKHIICDFRSKIANEDMEMAGGVFLDRVAWLSPVDLDFLLKYPSPQTHISTRQSDDYPRRESARTQRTYVVEDFATVHIMDSLFSSSAVNVIDKAIVDASLSKVVIVGWREEKKKKRVNVLYRSIVI